MHIRVVGLSFPLQFHLSTDIAELARGVDGQKSETKYLLWWGFKSQPLDWQAVQQANH